MSSINKKMEDKILYRQVKSIKAGQAERFKIHYTPGIEDSAPVKLPSNLWVKIKNKESIALRAAYLAGPYVLYVDCKPEEYDSNKKCFITADQPVFEPQLLPGQAFYAELSCHTIKESYCWVVDVISQIVFNNTIEVDFEILIGTSNKILHETSFPDKKVMNSDKVGAFISSTILNVTNQDTLDLWNLPIPDTSRPIHLVILTHGLHSNVSTDMLYLKEQIDKVQNDNIVVKGYFGNIGKTERGIKYLGSRVAEYIIELVTKNETFNNGKVTKISFIGHSLGGLVQTFAIAYLQNNFPWFFKKIKPINFITLASPFLGVVNENPVYVKVALSAGVVGITGQDLGLKYLENDSRPLLLLLPTGPTHQVLKTFHRRTVYANVTNDGIVPLRTSALLYLDYKGLSQVINSTSNTANAIKSTGSANKIPSNKNIEGEGSSFSPVQAMLSYFMPQKQRKKSEVQYHRFQTTNHEGKLEENTITHCSSIQEGGFDELPKSSVLETASSLILPPLPSLKYITDPESRDNVIIHDKVYYESDLPPRKDSLTGGEIKVALLSAASDSKSVANSQSTSLRQRLLETIDYSQDIEDIEEQIAREYHKNMGWRKVLVKLKPDAHNNIIVRRRLANAYGWPVIEHLVNNHFEDRLELSPNDGALLSVNSSHLNSFDSLDNEIDLSNILSRDLISKQNDDIDKQKLNEEVKGEQCEHHWINSKDNAESLFAVGPTGLLSDVSELVGNLRDQWYNYGNNRDSVHSQTIFNEFDRQESKLSEDLENESNDLNLSKSIMGDFI